jgi:NDP-sugar pyrophosphorylase family protein
MKWILICPWAKPLAPHLGETDSLATMPLLGQNLIEYWLGHLACNGAKEVIILADERPELIQVVAGDGARWGLSVRIIEESRELTPAQTLLKYQRELDPGNSQNRIVLLDHLPGMPTQPLFEEYEAFFKALIDFIPRARTPERVGVREIQPGIWAGLHCHVSADAQLNAPCWLGKNVFIGSKAVIGPNTIVEDGSFIDSMAAVSDSLVGADTYVGQCSEIAGSLAFGDTLIKTASGIATKIPDQFVLCGLRRPKATPSTGGWLERLSDLCIRNKSEASLLWKHFLMNRES